MFIVLQTLPANSSILSTIAARLLVGGWEVGEATAKLSNAYRDHGFYDRGTAITSANQPRKWERGIP